MHFGEAVKGACGLRNNYDARAAENIKHPSDG